ncbi:L-lactate dehydrogenase [Candidatus Woesearchaeota archaeon]|nr:L-lactate dehydrogenase [Candidatus Woesearchaeota archaeon]
MPRKVAIIGAGFVGSTAAYALLIKEVADEIILVDVNKEKAEGHAMDLEQGIQFVRGAEIKYSDSCEDCRDADVIVITAGLAQKPGETRLDLVNKNAELFRKMIPQITKHSKDAVIVVVSNPVDVLTYLTIKYSGFSRHKVFGTGTTLDTARFRFYISEHFNVNLHNVHAYILGEHGDSEFPVWSNATIAGLNVSSLDGYSKEVMDEIFQKTKNSAYEIIAKKGSTYYAIGLVIAEIVDSILHDESRIFPVSTYIDNYYDEGGMCISMPCVIGKEGIKRKIQVPLTDEEQQALHKSAGTLKEYIEKVEK